MIWYICFCCAWIVVCGHIIVQPKSRFMSVFSVNHSWKTAFSILSDPVYLDGLMPCILGIQHFRLVFRRGLVMVLSPNKIITSVIWLLVLIWQYIFMTSHPLHHGLKVLIHLQRYSVARELGWGWGLRGTKSLPIQNWIGRDLILLNPLLTVQILRKFVFLPLRAIWIPSF